MILSHNRLPCQKNQHKVQFPRLFLPVPFNGPFDWVCVNFFPRFLSIFFFLASGLEGGEQDEGRNKNSAQLRLASWLRA